LLLVPSITVPLTALAKLGCKAEQMAGLGARWNRTALLEAGEGKTNLPFQQSVPTLLLHGHLWKPYHSDLSWIPINNGVAPRTIAMEKKRFRNLMSWQDFGYERCRMSSDPA